MGFTYSHSPTWFKVLTLHAGVCSTLSNHMLAFFLIEKKIIFSLVFVYLILSFSNQVLGSQSPCTYLVYSLQADVGFFFLGGGGECHILDTLTYLVYTLQQAV